MNDTHIFIQARMDSSRLKRKMTIMLGEKKIIEWVIERLKPIEDKFKIILTTTSESSDDELFLISKNYNIDCFRGSTNNVVKRFLDCAKINNTKRIIRVCADNPFVDSNYINTLVNFDNYNHDYCYNNLSRNKNDFFPDGFGAEILDIKTLTYIKNKTNNKDDLEHIPNFILKNPKSFRIGTPICEVNQRFPDLKFDIDNLNDLKYLNSLIYKGVKISSGSLEILNIANKLQ